MAVSSIPQPVEPIVKTFLINGKLPGNAGFHNSIYRGKYLGSSLTAAQSAAIEAGTFDDLYIGDYWTINGVDWVIAEFDPKYGVSDKENGMQIHHAGVIPRGILYKTCWNETDNTATGGVNGGAGYMNSFIRANIKSGTNGEAEGAQLKVIAAFGSSHVKEYRDLYPSAYSGQIATTLLWDYAKVELMSEFDVYGANVWSGSGFENCSDKHQLAIFRLNPAFANIREKWWLRSVSARDTGNVAFVHDLGHAHSGVASGVFGVRPLAIIV